MKDRPFQLTDIVRETSYAIHRYHGCGHLERGRPAPTGGELAQRQGTECCRKKRKKTKEDCRNLVLFLSANAQSHSGVVFALNAPLHVNVEAA